MIFYKQNIEHDRNYLELQTRLNFAYWIAADAAHYFEYCDKNINHYEYQKLVKQFNLAKDMTNNIHISSYDMSSDHIKAINILKDFVIFLVDDSDFTKNRPKDSEMEHIQMQNQLDAQEKFIKDFLPYLHERELESYMQHSYLSFFKGSIQMIELSLIFENYDSIKFKKKIEKAMNEFQKAKLYIEKALNDPCVKEGFMDEFSVLGLKNSAEQDFMKFSELQFEFMQLWKESFMAFKQSYEHSFMELKSEEDEKVDLLMIDYQISNYLGLININQFKFHQFMFKKMNIALPNVEAFSERLIRSPIDDIKNK